jgi:hypothetical protein
VYIGPRWYDTGYGWGFVAGGWGAYGTSFVVYPIYRHRYIYGGYGYGFYGYGGYGYRPRQPYYYPSRNYYPSDRRAVYVRPAPPAYRGRQAVYTNNYRYNAPARYNAPLRYEQPGRAVISPRYAGPQSGGPAYSAPRYAAPRYPGGGYSGRGYSAPRPMSTPNVMRGIPSSGGGRSYGGGGGGRSYGGGGGGRSSGGGRGHR